MMQHLIIGDKIYTNPPEDTLISWSGEFFYLPDKFTKLVKNNFKICKIVLDCNDNPNVIKYCTVTKYNADSLKLLMGGAGYLPFESLDSFRECQFFYMLELNKKDFSKFKLVYF